MGFMGSGKSTAGRLLAQTLGTAFHDLDELIEDRPGKVLLGCRSIHEGKILDQRIIDFQHR